MPPSILRLIKNCVELRHKDLINYIPDNTRGIYALYDKKPKGKYDVVYIGMAGADKAGIKGRLRRHHSRKGKYWTHFSAFEVWDNIREEEIRELEGLFRHIYQKHNGVNKLNKQKGFKKLGKVRNATTWLKNEKQS
jgi:hypothetical protein